MDGAAKSVTSSPEQEEEIESSEGTMTDELAKQKVLDIHPDAWQSGTGHVWEYRSVKKDYPMSEPLGNSWKNAAESLPVRDTPICPMCKNLSRTCPICTALEVAPVEVKEKCPRCESTNRMFRGTLYDRYGDWKCDDKWHDDSSPVAEPKPTPSTPIEAFCKKCRISITNTTAGVHECPACHGPVLKSQPDSSSIPDGMRIARSKWWDELLKAEGPITIGETFRAFEAGWDAAKGQSNGR